MNLNRYHKSGGVTHVERLSAYSANVMFIKEIEHLTHPLSNTYRITLTDPYAGDRILKDSDDNAE